MLNEVTFDIETSNSFADVGKYDASLLKVSLVGAYSSKTGEYTTYMEEDLPKLWPLLEQADVVIGYNLFGFDYKVLNTYYPGDLSLLPTMDLMVEIADNLGRRLKLDDVAHGTLGIGKCGNGLQAIEYWRRGEIDKLKEYCLQDVKVTKEVYEFGRDNGYIQYIDRMGTKQKVDINFKIKEEDKDKAVSMTLPL